MRVPAARPVFSDSDRRDILAMIDESLQSGALTLGPRTEEFEAEFLGQHGGRHAVAVASGTAAIEIVLRSLGVEGREVVVPTNTFFATAAAALHAGAKVRLADVDPATLALSAATVEAALSDSTAAVVAVHIGGVVSPAIDEIAALCADRGVTLVEDAAHAHGAALGGRPAGTIGWAGTFSFYPTKVVTSTEGGLILTDDEQLAAEARIYRDQGKAGFLGGDHVRLGSAWRMSEAAAAVGLVQLRRLNQFVGVRQKVAAQYDDALRGIEGITPLDIPAGCAANYYKYVAFLDDGIDREEFKARLREAGVAPSGEVYALPLHAQPVFASLPGADGAFPGAERACRRHVCLPVHSDMTDAEAEFVIGAVATALGR